MGSRATRPVVRRASPRVMRHVTMSLVPFHVSTSRVAAFIQAGDVNCSAKEREEFAR